MQLFLFVLAGLLAPATRAVSPGEPLFLTPYIDKGDVSGARKAATVPPLAGTIDSYSGFLTVNRKYNSNLFFWYFPAENDPATAPVVVWLQGGPGSSSMYGALCENGPFSIQPDGRIKKREFTWSRDFHMIFFDSPAGTGFSFTDQVPGYATNETDVGDNLYTALLQFLFMFPELQNNDVFITGESYGGKYVPAMAHTIHTKNKHAEFLVNMKGIAIGDGFVDPVNMMVYSEYLFEIGLLDIEGRDAFKEYENKAVALAKEGKYVESFKTFNELFNIGLLPHDPLFYNLTRMRNIYNYLHADLDSCQEDMTDFFKQSWVRQRIHVGNLTFHTYNEVEEHLIGDIMKSSRPWLEELIDHYRVLHYSGQLDIICAYPLTMNYVSKMSWKGREAYEKAVRKPWYVEGTLAGYHKSGGTFSEALVRNAGHMVPYDQPRWGQHLIKHFIFNWPL